MDGSYIVLIIVVVLAAYVVGYFRGKQLALADNERDRIAREEDNT